VQRIGRAGTALVDEHEVASFAEGVEPRQEDGCQFRGALAWSSGQRDDWIAKRGSRGGPQHYDAQIDRAAARRFRHAHSAAVSRFRQSRDDAWLQGWRHCASGRFNGGGTAAGRQGECEKGSGD
jgi:hypothetical protein